MKPPEKRTWQAKENEPLEKNDEDKIVDSGSNALEKAGNVLLTTGR